MVCCIEAGETPLSKGNRRFGEPSIAGRVVLQLVDKIFRWGSQTLRASLPGGIVAFSTRIPDRLLTDTRHHLGVCAYHDLDRRKTALRSFRRPWIGVLRYFARLDHDGKRLIDLREPKTVTRYEFRTLVRSFGLFTDSLVNVARLGSIAIRNFYFLVCRS